MKRRKILKVLISIGIVLLLVIGFLEINPLLSDPWRTEFQYINHLIIKLNNNELLTDEEYHLLSKQTGLCKDSINKIKDKYSYNYLLEYQEDHINNTEKDTFFMFFGIKEEVLVKDHLPFVDPQPGDILITSSNYTLGIRFGHVGLVLNGETGLTLESYSPGQPSDYDYLYTWNGYPKIMLLRLKEEYRYLIPEILKYAEDCLLDIDYSIFASAKEEIKKGESISKTQCAHLIWAAYMSAGIDLNSNGSWLVTGKDISRSEYLEVAEVKGYDFDELW